MDILALIGALILVLLNGFFVATEFAIVKVRPTRIDELLRKNRPGAAMVRHILAHIDPYLSATQLGITLASLALGWIGEPAFSRLIESPLAWVGVTDELWIHRISLSTAFVVISCLHIVVGEMAPKTLAISRPELVALAIAYPMRLFYIVFFPLTWVLDKLTHLLLKILGVHSRVNDQEAHSEDELKIILSQARSAGLLSEGRAELLKKALSLTNKNARHLMVPRNEVLFLDINVTWEENIDRAMQSGHTRFPLCDGDLDNVRGIVDIREVLYQATSGPGDLRRFARPAVYFPEMMTAERLLSEFRARRATLAVIVDEFGGASGIITVSDIISAVMGDLQENADSDLVLLPGGAYEVDGTTPLEEIEETIKAQLQAPGMNTLAGFLMTKLGRMPKAGDRVAQHGYLFNVLSMEGPKVKRVKIQRESSSPLSASSGR